MKRDLSNSRLELCELDDKEADNNSRLPLLLSLFINFNHQLIQSSYLHAFLSKSLGLQKIFSYLTWCLVVDISLSLSLSLYIYIYMYVCMYVCICMYILCLVHDNHLIIVFWNCLLFGDKF